MQQGTPLNPIESNHVSDLNKWLKDHEQLAREKFKKEVLELLDKHCYTPSQLKSLIKDM